MKLGILYRDGAVLQRGMPIQISGEGAGVLVVSVCSKSYRFDITEESWTVELPAMEAGGPFVFEFSLDGEPYSISDVWIGDVYLCAGQSNM